MYSQLGAHWKWSLASARLIQNRFNHHRFFMLYTTVIRDKTSQLCHFPTIVLCLSINSDKRSFEKCVTQLWHADHGIDSQSFSSGSNWCNGASIMIEKRLRWFDPSIKSRLFYPHLVLLELVGHVTQNTKRRGLRDFVTFSGCEADEYRGVFGWQFDPLSTWGCFKVFDKKARHEIKGAGVAHIIRSDIYSVWSIPIYSLTMWPKSVTFEIFIFGAWSCSLFG